MNAKAACEALGVARSALNRWMEDPTFPSDAVRKSPRGTLSIDVDAVRKWMETRPQQVGRPANEELTNLRRNKLMLDIARAAELVKQEQIETRRLAEEESLRQGNILPRDEWTQTLTEVITIARDQIAALPKTLAKLASDEKTRRRILTDGQRVVESILQRMVDSLEKGVAGE